jgi:DNA replication protein DnaC
MSERDDITPELKRVLRRLKLSPLLDTLPERLVLARQRKMEHSQFLELVLSAEAERRDRLAADSRADKGRLEKGMRLEAWDETAKVTYDRQLWERLCTLAFLESHHHVLILGPVGVGKSFLATALGHVACRRGHTVQFWRADEMLKHLKASRLDNSHDRELRKLVAVDLLIIDDFALDAMDHHESRDIHEILLERARSGSIVVTSNRDPAEWLAMLADPLRAQTKVDRLKNGAYELIVDGESYRPRQKPR